MWQIRPQPEFILAAFPSFPLYPHLFLHVLEKTPPPLSLFLKFLFSSQCTHKKKKIDQSSNKKPLYHKTILPPTSLSHRKQCFVKHCTLHKNSLTWWLMQFIFFHFFNYIYIYIYIYFLSLLMCSV